MASSASAGRRGRCWRRAVCLTARLQHARLLRAVGQRPPGAVRAARPVADWLADPQTPRGAASERLALSQRMRDFAVSELTLPDNAQLPPLCRPAAQRRGLERGRGARAVPDAEDLVLPGRRLRRLPRLLRPRRADALRGRAARAQGSRSASTACRPTRRSGWLPTGSAATRCSTPSSTSPRASWRG